MGKRGQRAKEEGNRRAQEPTRKRSLRVNKSAVCVWVREYILVCVCVCVADTCPCSLIAFSLRTHRGASWPWMKLKAKQGKARQGQGAHHTYLHSFLICRCFSLNAIGFLWFPVPAKRRHAEALCRRSNYTPRSSPAPPEQPICSLDKLPHNAVACWGKYLHATLECSTHWGFVCIHNSLMVQSICIEDT